MDDRMKIMINGYARHGKDAVADILTSYNFRKKDASMIVARDIVLHALPKNYYGYGCLGQMLSMVYSKWYFDWGQLTKRDGTPYKTEKGAFRGHPCTAWAAENINNTAWLIAHGFGLSNEYTERYGKTHTCEEPLLEAEEIFYEKTGQLPNDCYHKATQFPRAMPEEWKFDDSINTFVAYKRYIASKPWAATNYLRIPDRKPEWL